MNVKAVVNTMVWWRIAATRLAVGRLAATFPGSRVRRDLATNLASA